MVKWFKKISVIMMMTLMSGLILVGCNDLYSRLTLSISHANGGDTVEMVLVDGAVTTYDVYATVDGAKKGVSERVIYTIENGNNISIDSDYQGKGKTKLTITAKSHGQCTLTISTEEGNKSKSLTVIVYKKIESVAFNTEKLAIKKNGALDLTKYLTFTPIDTNQTAMNFELVRVVDDLEEEFAYSENYASISENGILTVDPDATLPIDPESNLPYVTVKGVSKYDSSITTEELNIPVIEMVQEEMISLQSNSNAGNVTLIKNTNGEYHVVLASNIGFTDVEGANSVLFKRRLTFIIGEDSEEEQNYEVLIDEKYLESYQNNPNRTDTEKAEFASFPVLITRLERIEGHVVFDVNQKKVNTMTVPFKIKYMAYDGLPEIEIKIKFEVVSFPTEISAKSDNVEITESNPLRVMNEYSGNLNGSPLTITTNNDNATSNLYFQYSIDKGTAVVASVKVATSNSMVTYEENTDILTGTTLYLFHSYSDTDVESIKDSYIVIKYTYDLNPASISGSGSSTGNFAYSIEKRVPLTFRMGIDKIPFVEEIVTNNYQVKIDASKPSEALLIDTSTLGGVYADEFTYTSDTDLFTLRIEKTSVYIVPNTEGMSGKYSVAVKDTMRNLYKACQVIIYVPFANIENDSMYLEIDGENNYKEEILNRTYEEKEVTLKTASDVELKKTYSTLTQITLKTNSSIPINAFNYILDPSKDSSLVTPEDDAEIASEKYIKKVNINHYLESVDISYRYGSFKDGVLTVNSNTYTNKDNPLEVIFKFTGYNSEGEIVVVTHTVQLLIYNLINTLNVSVSNPNIYEYNSVGALNAAKATTTISITNTLNNAAETSFELVDTVVKTFKTDSGNSTVEFRVSDLFTFNYTEGASYITIIAKAGGSITDPTSGVYKLNSLLRDYGSVDNVLSEIYATNFKIEMIITLTQFGRSVHSSVVIGTVYAVKSERIVLNNVNSNGLYFDIRNLSTGYRKDISFSVEPSNAYNKNIKLIYDENNVFNCQMLSSNVISIYPYSAGIATLRLAFEDSYEEVENDGTVTLVATKYVDIRIKVADGSELYAFEISTISDLEDMVRDINNGANSYHYVIADNLNLTNYKYVTPTNEFKGSLNGLFEYELDGTRYKIQSNIVGFNISSTDSSQNQGLFSTLSDSAVVKNLNFMDTNIVIDKSTDLNLETLNIGVIAGINNGSILNSRVTGKLSVTAYANSINVGGFAGYNNGIISGLPSINSGLGDSNINSNISITVNRILSVTDMANNVTTSTGNLNVGGIAGYSVGKYRDATALDVADMINLNVISSITTNVIDNVAVDENTFNSTSNTKSNLISVGGIIGYAKDSKLSNLLVRANNIIGTNNIGGIAGTLENANIYNNVIQFVNRGLTGLSASNIVGYTNLGAIAGKTIGDVDIKYTYARSFYNKNILELDNSVYYGNIVSLADGNDTYYSDTNTITVGGLVGCAEDISDALYLSIQNSYANLDINTSVNPLTNNASNTGKNKYKVGGLVGVATNHTRITNCYVLNNIKMPEAIKEIKTVTVTKENEVAEGGESGSVGESGGDAGEDDSEDEDSEPYADEEIQKEISSFGYFVGNETLDNYITSDTLNGVYTSYSVVNLNNVEDSGFFAYVTNTNQINTSDVVKTITVTKDGNTYDYKFCIDKNYLISQINETNGFKVTSDHGYNLNPENTEKMIWYINTNINEGLPVLFGGENEILYKVLPSSITAVVAEEDSSFTNNSHIKLASNKVVLFYNELTSGVEYLTNNTYKVVLSDNITNTGVQYNNVITVTLGVDTTLQGIVDVESAITIESTNKNVVEVENGNTLKVLGEGYAQILIYSTLDTTISTTVDVLVVNGLSNFYLYKNGIGDSNIVTTEEQLIIDKVNKYNVNIINKAYTNGVSGVYKKNSNVGYIITADEDNTGSLGVSTAESDQLVAGNSYIFPSLGNMNLIGFTSGNATLSFTPIIFTSDTNFGEEIYADGNKILTAEEVENAISNGTIDSYTKYIGIKVQSLKKNYNFDIIEKAKSITFANGNNAKTILPTGKAELDVIVVTSAYTKYSETLYEINEKLNVLIYKDGVEIGLLNLSDNDSSVEYADGKFKDRYNNSLIEFELVAMSYEQVSDENQVKITYKINLTFDQDKYLSDAENYSMNDLDYELKFYPATNTDLKDLDTSKFSFSIKPQEINQIYTAFYPSAQTNNGDEFNPLESATDYVAPGRYGLMTINVYPKFNEADYYEVTVPYEYRQNITLTQMYAIYDNSSESSILNGYRTAIPAATQLSDYMGIRLFSVSNTTRSFDGNLYVRVLVTSDIPEGSVLNFTINAYKNGVSTPIADPATCTVTVSPLPGITATVDGKTSDIIVAKTFSKTGIINAVEFTGEIEYEITSRKGSSSDYTLTYTDTGFVFTVLSSALGGDDATVKFSVYQVINGIREESSCYLYFKIVEFEVLDVSVQDAVENDVGENQLDLLNGVTKVLSVNITANIDASDKNIMAYKTTLEKYFAGKGAISTSVSAPNNWHRRNNYNSDPYNDISLTVTGSGSENALVFNQYEFGAKGSGEGYYIKAKRISDVNILVLKVAYYYDGSGIPRVYYSGLSTAYTIFEIDYVFRLNIKDNSTYDHPNPVYTYEDIANMQTGSHYILMNNLTFIDFVPFTCSDFASFDGNGYVITIENFDLSSYKANSTTQADIGLFESIDSGTIVKNLVLDISNLLISNYEMTTYLNTTNEEILAKYNKINAAGITSVNFGLIAANNAGTITNVKVVNTSNTNNNYLYVYTTQNKIETSTPNARIGGLVASNTGIISNSFIGVNASTTSDNAVYTGVVLGNYNTIYSYPFRICGSNNIAGVAYSNSGKIISTYANAVGVTNTCFLGDSTITAGFVGINNEGALISNCFTQGSDITNFRASDAYKIESKGNMGGLVCTNSGIIKDAYSNICISTNSGRSGGFVFENTSSGTITNAYSTAKNSVGSRAHGAFIGTNEIGEVNNDANDESISSVYYLVVGDEFVNENEIATPIKSTGEIGEGATGTSQADPFLYSGSFNGFSFSLGSNLNSIWTYTNTQNGPQLISCVANDTYSNRILSSTEENESDDGSEVTYTYNYDYITNVGDEYTGYGEKNNPLIVRNAKEFASFIINNSNAKNVFGGEDASVSYVRLIDDINFSSTDDGVNLNEYKVDGKLLSEIIFNGVLDGNNLTISGITLLDNSKGVPKDTYGLFKQVGADENSKDYDPQAENGNSYPYNAIIKNVSFEIDQLIATNVKMVGVVAGKSVNATYINTHVSGDASIQGRNIVGGLTGILAGYSSLIDVTSSVSVTAVYRSGAKISDVLPYFDYEFDSYSGNYANTLAYNNSECEFSYAGGIAGIIDAENTLILDKDNKEYSGLSEYYLEEVFSVDNQTDGKYSRTTTKYRTDEPTAPIIKDLTVSGNITITGEFAGGLFGYVGANTHIYNSLFELTNEGVQEINGLYASGGITAENHGILEKARVEHAKDVQEAMDEKISSEGSVVGSKYLFKHATPIIIGGLVGINTDAIIIDSYSKANVYNSNAYVAGGIIGKNKGYGMLQHVYSTGLVYSKYVMGGIIGYINASRYCLYDGERVYATAKYDADGLNVVEYKKPELGGSERDLSKTEKVVLDYVVALNTWNVETDQVITENFENVYSYVSGVETKYYNYSNVMPEIGNQYVDKMYKVHLETKKDASGTDISNYVNDFNGSVSKEDAGTSYSYSYSKNIGSVVGRISSYGLSLGSESMAQEIGYKYSNSDYFYAGIVELVNTSANTARTDADDTKKVMDIDKSKRNGSVKELEQNDVTVFSVTYGSNRVNNEDITKASFDKEYCCYNYYNYLGWQRGRSYVLGNDIEVEEGETQNLMTNNAFTKWISIPGGLDGGQESEKVFKISDKTGLPEYIVGIYSNMITISTSDEWAEYINSNATTKNKYFAVTKDIELNYSDTNFGKFEGTLIGMGTQKPTVKITATSGFTPVFTSITSANISNINFELKFTSSAGIFNADTWAESIGGFANIVTNSVFTNCSISVDYSEIERNIKTDYNTNLGAVFGKINNSTFRFGEEDFVAISNFGTNRITVQQTNDISIGLFAGLVQKSDLSTLPIKFTELTAVRVGLGNLSMKNIVIGGLIGTSIGTNYPSLKLTNETIKLDMYLYTQNNSAVIDNAYVGGLFGKVEAGSISKIAHVGSIYVGPSDAKVESGEYIGHSGSSSDLNKVAYISNIYAGGAVAYANQSSKLTNVSNGVRFEVINGIEKISANTDDKIYVNGYKSSNGKKGTNNIAVGGIIGKINNGSIYGSENELTKAESANNATIKVTNNKENSINYVGGIVGYVEGLQNVSTVGKVYNSGEIETDLNGSMNYVGGIIGNADAIEIEQTYNLGKINQKSKTHITGGIVGAIGKSGTSTAPDCSITKCISYADIEVESAISANAKIGGILGSGMFTESNKIKVSNCVSMSRPINTNDNTTNIQGIANSVEASNGSNYYIAEFATGANIGTGVTYGAFGTTIENALCGSDSEFSMLKNGNTKTITISLNSLYSIKTINPALLVTGSKYNPKSVSSNSDMQGTGASTYCIISNTSTLSISTAITDAADFTGLFASTDSVTIEYSGNKPLIGTNKGILSGIKLLVSNNSSTYYLTRINDTSGVIYNCGVIGVVANSNMLAPIADQNNGRIIQTGVTLVNTTSSSSNVSGFVMTNKGVIYQSYTTMQMPNLTSATSCYGLAKDNSGSIKNSYFAGWYNGNTLTSLIKGEGVYHEKEVGGSTSSETFFGGVDTNTGTASIGSTWKVQGANNYGKDARENFGYPILNPTIAPNALHLATRYVYANNTYTYNAGGNYYLVSHKGMFANMYSVGEYSLSEINNNNFLIVSNFTISSTYSNSKETNNFAGNIIGIGQNRTITTNKPLFEKVVGGKISNLTFTTSNSVASIIASDYIRDTNIDSLTFENCKASYIITPQYEVNIASSGITLSDIVFKGSISGTVIQNVIGKDSSKVSINRVNYPNPVAFEGITNNTVNTNGGLFDSIADAIVEYCVNKTEIKSTTTAGISGGIIGLANNSTITNCTNYASLTNTNLVASSGGLGGIVGYTKGTVSISKCYVRELSGTTIEIKGNKYLGGVVGNATGTLSIANCKSEANISGDGLMGGIIGNAATVQFSGSVPYFKVITVNPNKLNNIDYVGGIIGSCASVERPNNPTITFGGTIKLKLDSTVSIPSSLKGSEFSALGFKLKSVNAKEGLSYWDSGQIVEKGKNSTDEVKAKVNLFIGNKKGTGCSGSGNIIISQSYARYSLNLHSGTHWYGLADYYWGVYGFEYKISMTRKTYNTWYVYSYGEVHGSIIETKNGSQVSIKYKDWWNSRSEQEIYNKWNSAFANTTFSV